MNETSLTPSLHPVLWLWLPVGLMVIQICMEIFLSHDVLKGLHSENGPYEIAQFLITSAAFVISVWALTRLDFKQDRLLAGWFGLAAICCFYVAGEEISWGQHFADWGTPEFWMNLNDQQETNLHNVSSWFDQKPRLILEIGVVTGSIIIPLLKKYKATLVPQQFEIIYPPVQLAVIAALAIGGKIAVKIGESFDLVLFNRYSEVEELLLFYFVFLYLLWLKNKVSKAS